jgi:hypothetical protein
MPRLRRNTLKKRGPVEVGLVRRTEDLLPDYSLVPDWHQKRAASLLFRHRGCVRACSFCAVPALEGKPFQVRLNTSIRHLIHPEHKSVVLWDNNILGEAHWPDVVAELKELGLAVDFNQRLDARFVDESVAHALKGLKIPTIRLAYDHPKIGRFVKKAVDLLTDAGLKDRRKRHIISYVLYNYKDTPQDLFERIRDLLEWGSPRIRCDTSHSMAQMPLRRTPTLPPIGPGKNWKWSHERGESSDMAERFHRMKVSERSS